MPNVITVSMKTRQKYSIVGLAFRANKNAPPTVASVKAAVADGDTVSSRPHDNLGVRFLGVDAPEKALPIGKAPIPFYPIWSKPKTRKPGEKKGKNDDGLLWTRFLANTALQQYPVGYGDGKMEPELRDHLEKRLQAPPEGAAKNHRHHALKADEALTNEIQNDMRLMDKRPAGFRFYLAFAHDVMDGFGRLLCYINRYQADETKRKDDEKKKTDQYYFYQERLLRAGLVSPFFMWPNVDPFVRKQTSALVAAVLKPADVATLDRQAPRLREARQFVRAARTANGGNGIGIFNRNNPEASPLALEAFEMRFLSRGQLPRRSVIDLSATTPADEYYGVLIEPQKYFYVKNPEDRLFVPEEFVPLFLQPEYGWRKRAAVALPAGQPAATAMAGEPARG